MEKVRQLAKRRNVVILCDGTSNEPGPTRTNVARLFKGIEKSHRQISFYDPGIGTFGYVAPWSRRLQRVGATLAQATGYGLDDNVLDAYRFLCSEHQVGDRIMLFGFSRGAYTVRVLAGLIHLIGVLRPEHMGLAPLALKAYKQSGEAGNMTVGWDFANALGARPTVIDFVGVWDTVSSVIVPLKDRLTFDLQTLPYTRKNPSVAVFRHAMAIDERRRMFRLNRWIEGQQHVPDRFDRTSAVPQDSLQVWFAGAHGDVGGGHSEQDSGLAKVTLAWMAHEAQAHGLHISEAAFVRMTAGSGTPGDRDYSIAPDPLGPSHPQPAGAWWALEFLPKSVRRREDSKLSSAFGTYLPRGEPRYIANGDAIHESVAQRIGTGYAPSNLPVGVDSLRTVATGGSTAP